MFKFNIIYRFASLFCAAVQGLVSSRQEAASILGVDINASSEEVNAAYKRKAKELHPDLNPNADPMQMKLLNSAKEIMLSVKEPEIEPIGEEIEDPYPSYEEIAEMRKELGREEFDRRYPNWINELKREMGLDEYNKLFEGYDPNYNPYDDPEYQANQDAMWERLSEQAYDVARDLYDKVKEDGKLELFSRAENFKDLYPELIQIPEWIKKYGLEKKFNKQLEEAFEDILFNNLEDIHLSLEQIMEFPNVKVIKAFLLQDDNFKADLPDSLLAEPTFAQAVFELLKGGDFFIGKKVVEKYKNNPVFLDSIAKSANRLHFLRENDKAKELLKNLPFDEKTKALVYRWMNIPF